MKIIIAPTKRMVADPDTFPVLDQPAYLAQTAQLLTALRRLTLPQAQHLWHCSDRLARQNYEWLQKMDLHRALTPAILAYQGLQYQTMAPDLLTQTGLTYLQTHLRILSGFYGMLRPFDGIVPYRLEMQAKLAVGSTQTLYQFWGDRLASDLAAPHEPIINLASVEYAQAIIPYLPPNQPLISIVFASEVAGRLKVKATLAKQGRGAFVRYLAEHTVTDPRQLTAFDHPAYRYLPAQSTATRLVFLT